MCWQTPRQYYIKWRAGWLLQKLIWFPSVLSFLNASFLRWLRRSWMEWNVGWFKKKSAYHGRMRSANQSGCQQTHSAVCEIRKSLLQWCLNADCERSEELCTFTVWCAILHEWVSEWVSNQGVSNRCFTTYHHHLHHYYYYYYYYQYYYYYYNN